jgi:hypothetical protein
MILRSILAAGIVALASVSASAQSAVDLTRDALYAGNFDEGTAALEPLAAAGDTAAKFGVGLIGFVSAVEGFAQALYRHGLASPETGPMGPSIDLPIPINPAPQSLDYEKVRDILGALSDGLTGASATLEAAGDSGDYVVLLDPLKIRVDVNGNGAIEEGETIENVFVQALGMPQPGARPVPPPSAPERDGRSQSGAGTEPAAPDTTIGFDRADAIWLAGYSQVLAAQADFLLAHDFSDLVASSFHRLFPRAGLPMQEFVQGGMLVLDPETDTAIADAVAAIHTLSWPVVEPERLKRVLERGRKVIELSRRNWDAILVETDDQRELVPNPSQTAIVPDGVVTNEIVAAWRETLDVAEQILNGELLVPHWRFRQGFDLKAYFETARRTDLVMLLTGYDALPFLKDGPVATAESFAAANRVFGNELLGYVFWFN